MTARASKAKRTIWREAAQVQGNIRRRCYARRRGYTLFVLAIRVDGDTSRVWARLDDPRMDDGVDVSRMYYHGITKRTIAAQIAVAKRWAETEADKLAVAP